MLQSKTVRKYDTYKDSGIEWIGEIPQEWNTITLKRVFSNRDGGAWGEEAQNNENDRICIRIADFDYPKMTIKHDIDYTVRNYTTDVIEKLALQKNDILIEKSGGGDQTPVGRTIIFNEDFNALYANFMDRLRVKQSISPKFIQYLLVSFYQNGITYQYIKQTTGIQNLDLTNLLAKESIVLPILDEQQRIAEYLDKKCGVIDRVVETEKAVIEKLKEYKQSIITEAVTKGLDKTVPLKDSGIEWIGKIPQHWEDIKLKFCTYIRARLGWKGLKAEEYVEEGYPLLSAFNIVNSKLIFEDLNFINQYRYDESPEIKLQEQDILLVKDGAGIGKCAIVENMPIPSTVNGSIAVITTNYLLMGKFLYYYFLSDLFQAYIDRLKDGMGVPHLFQSDLKEITIVIPNISEQQQIAEYLDNKCFEIDKAIADKEQIIEKFTEYKKSLIYECVTGKRKVV